MIVRDDMAAVRQANDQLRMAISIGAASSLSCVRRMTCQTADMSESRNTFEVIATDDGWKISGDIDASATPALSEAFDAAQVEAEGRGVVVDVEAVTFIDSSGLRVLIDLSRRIAPGHLTLRAAPRSVRRLLDLTGLSDAFQLEDALSD